MPDPTTTSKGYAIPTHGSDVGTWDAPLNSNFTIIDKNLGASFSQSMAAGSATISATDAQNMAYVLSGALPGNANLSFPAVGGFYIIYNGTTGAFTVTVITVAGGSTGVIVPQGQRTTVYSDGTNVYPADSSGVLVGEIKAYGGLTQPANYIFCYGQSLLRATYPALFTVIGTQYGAVDGTHFNIPDLRGRVIAGVDDMGGSAAGRLSNTPIGFGSVATNPGNVNGAGGQTVILDGTQIPNFTLPVSVTGAAHSHAIPINNVDLVGSGSGSTGVPRGNSGSTSTSDSGVLSMTGTGSYSSGGTGHSNVQSTMVLNYMIRYQ